MWCNLQLLGDDLWPFGDYDIMSFLSLECIYLCLFLTFLFLYLLRLKFFHFSVLCLPEIIHCIVQLGHFSFLNLIFCFFCLSKQGKFTAFLVTLKKINQGYAICFSISIHLISPSLTPSFLLKKRKEHAVFRHLL